RLGSVRAQTYRRDLGSGGRRCSEGRYSRGRRVPQTVWCERRRAAGAEVRLTCHPLGAEAEDHLVGALVRQGLAEQIALDGVATEVAHALKVLGGRDALGGDAHAEALGELDDRLNDGDILGSRAGFANEAAVDLQLVEHGLVQVADRRIAGSEIVERDADPER